MKKKSKADFPRAIVMAVSAVTDSPLPKGEDLLGSPELKRKFREAKKSLRRKPRGK